MTIVEATKQKNHSYLGQLMKKLIANRCCLALLRFFVAHPHGRFSKLAIVHTIDDEGNRPEVEKALTQMVGEGIVQTSTENDISFFRLTHDEPVRRVILEMAEFDWRHWQMVLEHM